MIKKTSYGGISVSVAADTEYIRLTSSEVCTLWSNYMGDSMATCMLRYFRSKVEDPEVRDVLDYALHLSGQHLETVTQILHKEGFPIPHGFGDQDVNLNAKRLYSDSFILFFLKNTTKEGLAMYAISLATSARSDVRSYISECLSSVMELDNRVTHTMLSKGLYTRPAYLPYPEQVEWVQKESFLNGIFGDKRPLACSEVSHLHANIQTNAVGKTLIAGFAQTARTEEIKRFFVRGMEISRKQIEVISSFLQQDGLPFPMTWDSELTESLEPPFSEKLMLFHILGINTAGLINYGVSMSVTMRRDITAMYTRLIAEVSTYADDGAEMMIEKGWMEKPPSNVDRKALIGV